MKRLYLRVLMLALAAFLVGASLVVLTMSDGTEADLRVIERTQRGGALAAVAELEASDDVAWTLAELRAQHALDVQLVERSTLGPGELARVDAGDTIFYMIGEQGFVGHAVQVGGAGPQVMRIGPLPDFEMPTGSLLLNLLAGGALSAVLLALGLLPTLRSLRKLEAGAGALAGGDFAQRVDETGDLSVLARALNELAEKNEAHQKAQKELLHAVSHELRTPLARLAFALEALPVPEAALADAEAEIDHLDGLVGELLAWSRAGEVALELESVDLQPLLVPLAARVDAELAGESVVVAVDAGLLRRCLDNLLRNAARHGRSPIRVSWRVRGERVEVCVDDAGEGIVEADRTRVLDPFVQLGDTVQRGQGGGHGLGLSIAERCCVRHGGALRLSRAPELGGLRVCTDWPKAGTKAGPSVQSDTVGDTTTTES